MSLSKLDFISPKITLYYNGNSAHTSYIGGLLSLFFLILVIFLLIKIFFPIIYPEISSIFIYEENIDNAKYSQNIDYSGFNHFIRIYGYSNGGVFGDYDSKNILFFL